MNLVHTPEECSKCDKLACSLCVRDWKLKSENCSHCNTRYVKKDHVTRFVLQTLEKMRFKCVKCPEEFSYANAQQHMAQHQPPEKFKCPLDCGHPERLIGREGLRIHMLTDCVQVMLNCSCGMSFKRMNEHSCV
jgi:ribosomal protein S3